MPQNIQTLSTFDLFFALNHVADADLDKTRFIVVKDSDAYASFKEVGKIGAFFASKAECRSAGQVLLAYLKANYGDTVAGVAEQDLHDVLVNGKALSARKVVDVLQSSEALSTQIKHSNAKFLSNFLHGIGATGANVLTFDKLVSQYCAQHGISEDAEDVKSALRSHVLSRLQHSTKMLTVDDIRREISSASPVQIQNHAAASSSAAVNEFNVKFLSSMYGLNRTQGEAILDDIRKKTMEMACETSRLHTKDTIINHARNFTAVHIFTLSGQRERAIADLSAKFGLNQEQQKRLSRAIDNRLRGLLTAQLGQGYGYKDKHFTERLTVESLYESIVNAEPKGIRNALKRMGFDEQRIVQIVSPPPAAAAAVPPMQDQGPAAAAAAVPPVQDQGPAAAAAEPQTA